MNSTIDINYRTRKEYCQCCNQKLPNVKTSEIKEFEFDKDILKTAVNWEEFAEFEEDLQDIIREYIYETISFFATRSDERLIIDNKEFEKVKQFIYDEVIS